MRQPIRYALSTCLLAGLAWLGGVAVSSAQESGSVHLNRAEVPVPDQSQAAQNAAVAQAFRAALAKLSGQRSIEDSAELGSLSGDAARWLRSVGYIRYEVPIDERNALDELRLNAEFDQSFLTRSARDLGLPLWSGQRPGMQLWLVVDQGAEGRGLLDDTEPYLDFLVQDTARRRGVAVTRLMPPEPPEPAPDEDTDPGTEPVAAEEFPVPLPAGGLDPRQLADAWGGFVEAPLAAATADGFDGVILAAAQPRNNSWELRWNAAAGEQRWTYRSQSGNLADALVEGLNGIVDAMAASYAIAPGDQGQWTEQLVVTDIHSADDYARCLAYLESLSVVEKLEVTEAGSGQVAFRLELNADPIYLRQALERGTTLEARAATGNKADYRLRARQGAG